MRWTRPCASAERTSSSSCSRAAPSSVAAEAEVGPSVGNNNCMTNTHCSTLWNDKRSINEDKLNARYRTRGANNCRCMPRNGMAGASHRMGLVQVMACGGRRARGRGKGRVTHTNQLACFELCALLQSSLAAAAHASLIHARQSLSTKAPEQCSKWSCPTCQSGLELQKDSRLSIQPISSHSSGPVQDKLGWS